MVRHGESEWNVARITQGQAAHPRLTDLGRAQAAAVASSLRLALGPDVRPVVITSDLVRATETAEIIVEEFSTTWRVDIRLREQSLGSLEGLSYEESFALGSALDLSDPDVRVPGGESCREVAERMSAVLHELAGKVPVVMVSHGDAIRAVLAARTGRSGWIDVPNGSVAVLDGTDEPGWLSVEPIRIR